MPDDRADARREADPELLDGDAGPLGDDEVAELVDEHQHDQHADEGEDRPEHVHQAAPPRPSSTRERGAHLRVERHDPVEVGLGGVAPALDRVAR